MTKTKSIFFKRTLYALIIVALIIPTFILTFYGHMTGRIIGMTIFVLLASLGLYEVCSFMTKNHFLIIIFSLALIVITFLLPYDSFLVIMTSSNSVTLKELIYFHFRWETFIAPFLVVILFMLVDKNLRVDFNIFVRNFPILIITSFLTAFLAKGVWVINIFDWTKVIFVLAIAVVSDTFAYFGGALFGKKWFHGAKLAPKISPSKTWAGAIVAFTVTLIFASITSYYIGFWNGTNNPVVLAIIGSLILALIAQFGDLLFSWFKRVLHIKDFSSLIPIHGGIFDRVDGISLVIFITIILFIVG